MEQNETADLVEAAKAGDQRAFTALYEKTYSQAYYTAKSMIKDEDTVLDILQDSYILAFQRLDKLQGCFGICSLDQADHS